VTPRLAGVEGMAPDVPKGSVENCYVEFTICNSPRNHTRGNRLG
jgi:hypothetical protein